MGHELCLRQFYFDLGLLHPSVISSWFNVMDNRPGFTKEAETAFKEKVLAKNDPLGSYLLADVR